MNTRGDAKLKYNSKVDWLGAFRCGCVITIIAAGLLAYLIRLLP